MQLTSRRHQSTSGAHRWLCDCFRAWQQTDSAQVAQARSTSARGLGPWAEREPCKQGPARRQQQTPVAFPDTRNASATHHECSNTKQQWQQALLRDVWLIFVRPPPGVMLKRSPSSAEFLSIYLLRQCRQIVRTELKRSRQSAARRCCDALSCGLTKMDKSLRRKLWVPRCTQLR